MGGDSLRGFGLKEGGGDLSNGWVMEGGMDMVSGIEKFAMTFLRRYKEQTLSGKSCWTSSRDKKKIGARYHHYY